jgi:hypothetical protein
MIENLLAAIIGATALLWLVAMTQKHINDVKHGRVPGDDSFQSKEYLDWRDKR